MRILRLTALALVVSFIGVATASAGSDEPTVCYGSSKSNKYHLPSCPWAQKISADNRVVFKTKDEAAAKGYAPCKICKP